MIETGIIRCGEVYDLDVPGYLRDAVLDEGGFNIFGEPNYRLVWGWSRHEFRAGEFHEFDDSGNWTGVRLDIRKEPRYPQRDRFHLEVWMPPNTYGTLEAWYTLTRRIVGGHFVEHLGEYPSRGDYEQVSVCQTADGGFVLPTEQATRDIIRWHKRSRLRSSSEMKSAHNAEQEAQKAARAGRIHDIIDSKVKAFPWREWVATPGLADQPLLH